jgi:DNA invertase Pin-like site-specific DNA recombinase
MFENGTGEAMDYVAYYRVSTAGQARSGLGLAAQQEIVSRFLKPDDRLLAEFVEVQSGRKDNREQLWKAITLAKREKAALVIARLDRFSRRVSFIARVMEEGVKLVVAELPNATDFQLHIFAALAQEERRLISERTRVALAEVRKQGRVLGANGRVLAVQNREEAAAFARELAPVLDEIGWGLPHSYIAERLNRGGYRTRRGVQFCAQTVRYLLREQSTNS